MPKVTVIDILNRYLAAGKMPPKELLEAAANQEALKAPPPYLDPVQILAGGTGIGASIPEQLTPKLGQMAANELFGLGTDVGVPQLLKMAQKGVSGPMEAIGKLAGAGQVRGTQPFKGVKMPGGGVAAKGTSPLKSTGELSSDDANAMSLEASEFEPAGLEWPAKQQLESILMASKQPPQGVTGPLAPQGKTSSLPGAEGQGWAHVSQPTQPLTPFEAHENVTPPMQGGKWGGGNGETGALPGSVMEEVNGAGLFDRRTRPLEMDNRTMSLEPADIDEMVGAGGKPETGELLSALAKNLGPKDTLPLPENTLYHGMNVFGHKSPKDALASIANEGMRGGWFSEEPHQAFGPHFLATTPEDLPPLLIRNKQFNVDPEKEIIPRWKKMGTEQLHTNMRLRGKSPAFELSADEVKGRPATRSSWPNIHQLVGADEGGGGFPLAKGEGHVVPPEKLFLSDKAGQILGRMAPKGNKPNAIGGLWDKVRAFKNVLEEGTGNKQGTIDSVFHKLFGDDPELKGANAAQKVSKLKQFLAQPEPENTALKKIWGPFAEEAKAALLAAGEDIPK